MKTDIALHEIMRIDEQDDAQTEHSSLADPTQADAERPTLGQPFMKSEDAPTTKADDASQTDREIVATEVPVTNHVDDNTIAEASPASRPDDTTAAQPVMILHEAPSDAIDDATTVAEKSPVSRPDDTTAAQPVMSLHALPSDNIDTPAAPATDDRDLSIASAATSALDSTLDDLRLPLDSPVETLLAIKTNIAGFFEEVVYTVVTFYRNNQQLLITLGITLLVVMGLKLLFAGLNAIDDLPLVTPVLKLIGLVYVVRFIWQYIIREQDRHQLSEKIEALKAEVFGTQN